MSWIGGSYEREAEFIAKLHGVKPEKPEAQEDDVDRRGSA
jgi:hypothetical protein